MTQATSTAAQTPSTAATRYRWVICGLIFFATTINYVDRQILSLLKPILDAKLGWSDTQFGAINSVFQASYGLSVIFFGWFVDRLGVKVGYDLSIGAWSLRPLGIALGTGVVGFSAHALLWAWAKAVTS